MDNTSMLAIAESARVKLANDPKTAMSQFSIAKHVLAYRCFDSDVDEAFLHLLDIVEFRLEAWRSMRQQPTTEGQNEGIIVASAVGSLTLARELAAIAPLTNNSHPFDIQLNVALRKKLGAEVVYSGRYRPIPAEEPLLLAFESSDPSSIDVSSYWRATRNRRYSRTPFEKFDFFSAAAMRIKNG